MFTVCPKCDLALAISVRDLRAAQGNVRCGRCHNVFNALDSLCEEHPHAAPETAGIPAEQASSDATAPAAPSSAGPDEDLSDIVTSEEICAEFDAASAEPQQALSDVEPSESPGATAQTDSEPAPELEPEPDPQEALPELAGPEPAEEPEADFAFEHEARHASVGWAVGAVLLTLVLTLQIVNHYRNTLATYPSIAGPMRAAYSALGIRLTPRWNVHAYDARQLGATVSGTNPHEITVRASIANLAQEAQPLPLLRVTLQDRFGRPIAARDVPPRDYLPSVPSPPVLPPGGRIDASVALVSPGPQAVGFEIDACLSEDDTVVCAHGS